MRTMKPHMKNAAILIAFIFFLTIISCSKGSSDSTTNGAGATVGVSGSLARFAATASHLYTISNEDINTYDISTASNPVFQSEVKLGFGIETIFPRGNNLFIGTQTGMRIMDLSNADAPRQISSFSHIRSCDPVVANDKYAFVTLRDGTECARGVNELQVLDISNLNYPVLVKAYPMTRPYGLALDGNNLFICDGGIKYYNASNVQNLALKEKVVIEATDLIANNGILMVIGSDGLYQYSYTDGTLKFLSKISTSK